MLSLLLVLNFCGPLADPNGHCDIRLYPPPRLLKVQGTPGDASSAIGNEVRIWRALSGDTMELDGQVVRLRGVSCPDPETADGRAAKALLNTFLRGGYIECALRSVDGETLGDCAKEGRDIATGMRDSGYCE
jgi:hypothetical protein